jgi:hypothetical protein
MTIYLYAQPIWVSIATSHIGYIQEKKASQQINGHTRHIVVMG